MGRLRIPNLGATGAPCAERKSQDGWIGPGAKETSALRGRWEGMGTLVSTQTKPGKPMRDGLKGDVVPVLFW